MAVKSGEKIPAQTLGVQSDDGSQARQTTLLLLSQQTLEEESIGIADVGELKLEHPVKEARRTVWLGTCQPFLYSITGTMSLTRSLH